MKKGVVLNAAVPKAEESLPLFTHAVEQMQRAGMGVVEIFAKAENLKECKRILDDCGMEGIFLSGIPLKRYGIDLCAPEKAQAEAALQQLFPYLDPAIEAGFTRTLITSGRCPDPAQYGAARESLLDAVDAIYARYGEGLSIVLEPSDRHVDAKQYLGPTPESIETAAAIRAKHSAFSLTLDTSHIAQLDEDVVRSLQLGRDVCRHIHLANCILKPEHPLYGDKHPMLDHAEAVLAPGFVHGVYESLGETYDCSGMTISMEIIDRSGRPEGCLGDMIAAYPWFFHV